MIIVSLHVYNIKSLAKSYLYGINLILIIRNAVGASQKIMYSIPEINTADRFLVVFLPSKISTKNILLCRNLVRKTPRLILLTWG